MRVSLDTMMNMASISDLIVKASVSLYTRSRVSLDLMQSLLMFVFDYTSEKESHLEADVKCVCESDRSALQIRSWLGLGSRS